MSARDRKIAEQLINELYNSDPNTKHHKLYKHRSPKSQVMLAVGEHARVFASNWREARAILQDIKAASYFARWRDQQVHEAEERQLQEEREAEERYWNNQ